jgi:putative DNA primase/helicase
MSEAVRRLSAAEITAEAERHIDDYLDGGYDLEAKDIQAAVDAGVDPAVIAAIWAHAKTLRPGKPKAELFICPPLLPKDVPAAPAQPEPASDWAEERARRGRRMTELAAKEEAERKERWGRLLPALVAEPEAEAEPESEAEPKVVQLPAVMPIRRQTELILDKGAPLDNARKLQKLRYWHEEGLRTLQWWQGEFWDWDGQRWTPIDADTMDSRMYAFLDGADIQVGRHRERFLPDMTNVNKTVHALRGLVNTPLAKQMPGWFGEAAPNVRELVSCQNGLLDVGNRRLLMHAPRFWSPNVLEFGYDHRAKAPRFERFLGELWPGDEEAQQALVELLGLCLTDETKYQKAFMFVGPKRGGRGTIARLIAGLIGRKNYLGTKLRALSEKFGMENFVGKKVAVFPDARLDGLTRRDLSIIAERLLNITGEDEQSIERKHKTDWEGTLTARPIVYSNEVLRFQDESGALPSRFVTWRMKQSFYGREDEMLTSKLYAERPGVLNLALDGLDRLRDRGRFLQPASGVEMSQSLGRLASDVSSFVEDICVVGPERKVLAVPLFQRWQEWCKDRGIVHGWAEPQFGEKLRAAVPSITISNPRIAGKRPTMYLGIGIRK